MDPLRRRLSLEQTGIWNPGTEASMERVMQRKGLCSHLQVGAHGRGREASQLGCLSRSLGLFKSQIHPNHIAAFKMTPEYFLHKSHFGAWRQ